KLVEEELLEKQSRLRLLNRISTGITSGMSVKQVAEHTLDTIAESFKDLRVCYLSIDEEGIAIILHSVEPEWMPPFKGLSWDLNLVPEYLKEYRKGDPILIENISDDPRLEAFSAKLVSGKTSACLDVPVKFLDKLVGCICLSSSKPHIWSKYEVETL